MVRVSRESSLTPPPDDNFTVLDLEEESEQTAIAGNLDGLTAGHKPIIFDDIKFSDETLLSAMSIGGWKAHVEMVLYSFSPGEKTANDSIIIGSHHYCTFYQEVKGSSSHGHLQPVGQSG
jgi:hypothetical protein